MITVEQARQYLQSQGIDNVPDFILAAWIEQLQQIQDCLDAHYPASTALLIQAYLLALFALAQADKYISSQTAPSGASRSLEGAVGPAERPGQVRMCDGADSSEPNPDRPWRSLDRARWLHVW